MAFSLSLKIFPLFLIIIILSLPQAVTVSAAVHRHELESMLTVLRSRGHNLFANAITTSDILYQVLTGTSFTFFVPTDSSLFALDMTASASDYIMTLRYHVVPRRISLSDLRTMPSGSPLPTLLQHHQIRLRRHRHVASEVFAVDGVEIAVPGLFFGRNIAVHALDGILSFRSHIGLRRGSSPPDAYFSGNHSSRSPAIGEGRATPPPANLSINHRNSPPPAKSSDHDRSELLSNEEKDNHTMEPQVPEPARVDEISPAISPKTVGFHLGIPPAYGSTPEISTSPTFPAKTQPPGTAISDANSPLIPPSIGDRNADLAPTRQGITSFERDEVSLVGFGGGKQESKVKNAFSGELQATMAPVMEDIFPVTTATAPQDFWPFNVDCSLKGGEILLGHVSVLSVDPCTPLHYTICGLTCPRTYT